MLRLAVLAHSFMVDLENTLHQFITPAEDFVFLTETLDRANPRANSTKVKEAKKREVKNL